MNDNKTETIAFRVSKELKEKLKRLAAEENRTIANYLNTLISKQA